MWRFGQSIKILSIWLFIGIRNLENLINTFFYVFAFQVLLSQQLRANKHGPNHIAPTYETNKFKNIKIKSNQLDLILIALIQIR